MRTRITKELARLASREYQYAHIVEAACNKYVVPEELVDTVCGTISTILGNQQLCNGFTSEQLACLHAVADAASQAYVDIPMGSDSELARMIEGEAWRRMRACAAACLLELGIGESEWEALLLE